MSVGPETDEVRAARARTIRLLAVVAVATTCGVLPGFLIGAQAVQLGRELGLDAASVGAAVAATWLCGSLTSPLMGRASERLGGRLGLRVAAVVAAGSMLYIAAGARSWATLAVGAAIGGVANALAQPSANVLIATNLPPWRHGLGFGVKQSAIPFATLVGGLAVPAVALTVGWRWTFALGAAAAATAAAALRPALMGATSITAATAATAASAPADRTPAGTGVVPAPGAPPPTGVGAAVGDGDDRSRGGVGRPGDRPVGGVAGRRRVLVVMGVAVGFGAAAAAGLAAFLVAGAVAAGIAEGAAGLLLALGSALVVGARLALGFRADRVGVDQLGLVALLMGIGAVALAVLGLGTWWAYLVAVPFAFGAGWAWPGLFNLSVVRRFPVAPGAATGVTQTGTYLGAAAGPVLFGLVVEARGFEEAWLVAALCAVAACSVVLILRRWRVAAIP
ncbi:MAG: MFS transporter [Acidimicrobiia bacterium]|nr:MFS transporter [Acidimicrobiia bacterium]